MNAISTIEMYNILKGKLGENEAKALTEYVESKVEVLATKEDLANVKSDIIKWMFIFWIGQIAVTFSIVYFRS